MADMEMFPQHPKSGFYFGDKGQMLAPHIEAPLMSNAEGETRHQTSPMSPAWDSTTIVNTGLTPAETSYATDLPNHTGHSLNG